MSFALISQTPHSHKEQSLLHHLITQSLNRSSTAGRASSTNQAFRPVGRPNMQLSSITLRPGQSPRLRTVVNQNNRSQEVRSETGEVGNCIRSSIFCAWSRSI